MKNILISCFYIWKFSAIIESGVIRELWSIGVENMGMLTTADVFTII